MTEKSSTSDRSFRAVWQAWRSSTEGKACANFSNLKSGADLEDRLKAAFAEGWNSAPCELPAALFSKPAPVSET